VQPLARQAPRCGGDFFGAATPYRVDRCSDPSSYSGNLYANPDAPTDNSDESGGLSAGSGLSGPFSGAFYPSSERGTPPGSKDAPQPGRRDVSPARRRGARGSRTSRTSAMSAPIPESPMREIVEHTSLSASISPGGRDNNSLCTAAGNLGVSGAPLPPLRPLTPISAEHPPPPLSLDFTSGMAPESEHSGNMSARSARGPRRGSSGVGKMDLKGVPNSGESVPIAVSQWSQDHTSVTLFLALEKFNPSSLMVQIQQHMVIVMALNSDGPKRVLRMRPEHAVRVQGSKSRPQPGSGIQLVLQKRSPGNTWSTFGQTML
jgi:hypothetical protein